MSTPPETPGDGSPEAGRALTAAHYREFARHCRGESPLYHELSLAVAEDAEVLDLLLEVEPRRRQPTLLLAAVRLLAGVVEGYPAFREAVLGRRDELLEILRTRRTQTNEVGRCAPLVPLLARLPQPLALIEIGASAGLCLLLDRYRFEYGGYAVGEPGAEPLIRCEPRGRVPIPAGLPEIAWRRGIDVEPVDVRDEDSVRWLECCVWPEQRERLERLRQAIAVARRDPPQIVTGDAVDLLPEITAEVPVDATLVVVNSAMMMYLSRERRRRLADVIHDTGATWIASESPALLPEALTALTSPIADDTRTFLVAQDLRPVALAHHHGAWVEWIER